MLKSPKATWLTQPEEFSLQDVNSVLVTKEELQEVSIPMCQDALEDPVKRLLAQAACEEGRDQLHALALAMRLYAMGRVIIDSGLEWAQTFIPGMFRQDDWFIDDAVLAAAAVEPLIDCSDGHAAFDRQRFQDRVWELASPQTLA
jgi:hypothetical protein